MHGPAEVHVHVDRRLHHIGRLDQPLATARGHQDPEDRGVDRDHDGKATAAAEVGEQVGQVLRDGQATAADRSGHHGRDRGVQRVLNQHTGRHRQRLPAEDGVAEVEDSGALE
ncbi:MAG: hypothetical protein ABIW17_08000 [Marmoricola sp.]